MKRGFGLGAVLVVAAVTAYGVLLGAPGAWFYPFAAFVFIACPLLGAGLAVRSTRRPRFAAALATGAAIFGLAGLGFLFAYAVYPEFERTSVQLPAACGTFASGAHPPGSFIYELAGVGPTTLITRDDQTAVVAAIDFAHAPFPSTAYLVRRSDNHILWQASFENDSLSAALDDGTLYFYNDKIGYWIDARTGLPTSTIFTIDNYGGLSPTDRPVLGSPVATGRWYLETTAVISSWRADGSVISLRRVTFNALAFNCFVDGQTGGVTQL